MAYSLLLHPNAVKRMRGLDGSLRTKIADFMFRFGSDPMPPGLHFKRLKGDGRRFSARVGADHRAILFQAGDDTFLLEEVRPRGDAYERIDERPTFPINQITGDIEHIDYVAIDALQPSPQVTYAPHRPSPEKEPGLFAAFTDTELTSLGVAPTLLPAIAAITDEEQLFSLLEALPLLTAEILLQLFTGKSIDEVTEQITAPVAAPEPVDTNDYAAALARPGVSVTTVDDAVRVMLDGEFEGWRLWLHPTQAKLIGRAYAGPARVSGGPGTGKTVVAVHRAAALARRLPPGDDKPILLTTYNTNLAGELAERLGKLLSPVDLARVEIVNIDKVTRRIAYAGPETRTIAQYRGPLLAYWKQALSQLGESDPLLTPEFLHEEWTDVICGQLLDTRAAYIAARRDGRGVRLTRAQRDRVWTLTEVFTAKLAGAETWTWDQMRVFAARSAETGAGPRYRHVIVDEAQDLTPAQWRMLRALVPPGPDDLFLVGDSHQRIYGHPVSLGAIGVNIRGRSSRLTLSYRTTRQILAAAVKVLDGESFDDLDDGTDGLTAYRSILSGPTPLLRPTTDELATVIEEISADPGELVVCAPTVQGVADLLAGIRAAGIDAGEITGNGPPRGVRVHVGTMHRLKGLEYPRVIITGVGADVFPPVSVRRLAETNLVAYARELKKQRCLLFVASTRARDALTIVWSGGRSVLLG